MLLLITSGFVKISARDVGKFIILGMFLGIHWFLFYGSIKFANVSIAVVCLSSMGFFSALLEPLILKRKLEIKEVVCSLISILGILFIFKFDSQYRLGITVGLVGALFASIYTILNKKLVVFYDTKILFLYEMIGSSVLFLLFIPFYIYWFSFDGLVGSSKDYVYLFLLASICTVVLYLLQISATKVLSAFTVNLSYNLEPIYSIILAIIVFQEGKELNFSFFVGIVLIILSVILQSVFSIIKFKKEDRSNKFIPFQQSL